MQAFFRFLTQLESSGFVAENLLAKVFKVGRIALAEVVSREARKVVGSAMGRPSTTAGKMRAIAVLARRQGEAFHCPWAGRCRASLPQEGFLAAGSHQGLCNELGY
ncbi:hypothetical protein [Pseudomonas protegens]|uniref:hypothetical protein n=1 Tax=Pseudomonas protegens TaxID=380021 RepID=UPI00383A9957